MKSMIAWTVLAFVAISSEAATFGTFKNVSGGFLDAWSQLNPENVRGTFLARFGGDHLFLVSIRQLRGDSSATLWGSPSRDGVVTTVQRVLSQPYVYSHSAYNRVADDNHGAKVFACHAGDGTDGLFMLTYTTNTSKVVYRNLYKWNQGSSEWKLVPLEIDPTASTSSTNTMQSLSLHVPKGSDKAAYLVASAYGHTGESEFAFSKLEVMYGNSAWKASLKSLAHERVPKPSAVVFTALKNEKLYAFVNEFMADATVSKYDSAHVLDLNTKRVSTVSLSGPAPTVDFDGENMHQTKNNVLIAGGRRTVGLGRVQDVDDIYFLNLNTLQWQPTQAKIPFPTGPAAKSTIDQHERLLYLVGMREGILESDFTRVDTAGES